MPNTVLDLDTPKKQLVENLESDHWEMICQPDYLHKPDYLHELNHLNQLHPLFSRRQHKYHRVVGGFVTLFNEVVTCQFSSITIKT